MASLQPKLPSLHCITKNKQLLITVNRPSDDYTTNRNDGLDLPQRSYSLTFSFECTSYQDIVNSNNVDECESGELHRPCVVAVQKLADRLGYSLVCLSLHEYVSLQSVWRIPSALHQCYQFSHIHITITLSLTSEHENVSIRVLGHWLKAYLNVCLGVYVLPHDTAKSKFILVERDQLSDSFPVSDHYKPKVFRRSRKLCKSQVSDLTINFQSRTSVKTTLQCTPHCERVASHHLSGHSQTIHVPNSNPIPESDKLYTEQCVNALIPSIVASVERRPPPLVQLDRKRTNVNKPAQPINVCGLECPLNSPSHDLQPTLDNLDEEQPQEVDEMIDKRYESSSKFESSKPKKISRRMKQEKSSTHRSVRKRSRLKSSGKEQSPSFRPGIPERKVKSVKKSADQKAVSPQEEVQYGEPSRMKFSNELTVLNLLRANIHNGGKPVVCLLNRDVSAKSRSLSKRSANRSPSSRTSFSERQHHTEDLLRGRPAINITMSPLSLNAAKITELIHAGDFPSVINFLGVISRDLSPESLIPSLFAAGVAYYKMDKHKEATQHFQDCETVAASVYRHGDVMLCNAYLGDIEYSSQSYVKAAEYYERAIKYYTAGSVAVIFKLLPPTLSAIHAKRAFSFRSDSKMLEAINEYKNAIAVSQTSKDKLSAHTSLGNLYQSMGDNSNALTEYKQSIELAGKLSDFVSLGWAHGNIGNAYLGLNRKDEALHHLKKSLDLAVMYEQIPQAIGRTYNNLGTAYQSINDLDKAEEYYGLALSQAEYGNDIAGQARVNGNIGNVHMLRKNYEQAIHHYSEVICPSTDLATLTTAQHNRGCAYYEWATRLTPIEPQQSRYHGPDCNVKSCLDRIPYNAREHYRKGSEDLEEVVKYHEKRFQHIKGSAQGLTLSVSLFESNSRTFHRIQDCLVNLHEWERALKFAEQSRARTLGELLLKKKRHQIFDFISTPLTYDQIVNIVKSQSCPLVFLSYTGARLIGWIFMLYSGKVTMHTFEVPLADDQFEGKPFDYHLRYTLTEQLVERTLEMYQSISYNEDSSSPVQRLYEIVAKPVVELLYKHTDIFPQRQPIICISDSYTSLLPLTCLLDPKSGFFGDRHCFKLAPSLLTLGIMSQFPVTMVDLRSDKQDFCVIGDPNIPPFCLNSEIWNLGKLPHAHREAEWVAHALQTKPILDENATKSALLNRSMRAKIIHIATHGSATVGFLAFASFAKPSRSNPSKFGNYLSAENVLLYPRELENLSIPAALVVLSSCDSGRGTVKADGIQGMARAFILAGAQSVLTTLWKVPDESASVFMQFFYQYLLDGVKSSVSLHKAILSVRCFAKYSQYIHWSGYQLTGRDIQFCTMEMTQKKILEERLGKASVFPHLNFMKMLENALVKNPVLPSYVQIVKGSPGVRPSEVVIDFITIFHQYFSGGIYWINCRQPDLLSATVGHIDKVLGVDKLDICMNECQKPLFVLDSLLGLPNSESLLRVLKCKHAHIIILFENYVSTDDLIKEVDHKLVRGCSLLEIKPLTVLHSAQRIVHSIMKDHDFIPTTSDQKVFTKLAEFSTGSPLIVNTVSEIANDFFNKENPIQDLDELFKLDEISQLEIRDISELDFPSSTRSTSENMYKLLRSANVQCDTPRDIWATHAPYDSWDSILILLGSCNLTIEERLLLNSLSIFGSCPVPLVLVTELASLITESSQTPQVTGTLHCKLLKYKLLYNYPQPVVLHSSVLHYSNKVDSEFVYVPQYISQCIWKTLDDLDKICILNLLVTALRILHQTTPQHNGLHDFLTGMCSLVLECLDSESSLPQECYLSVYSLWIKLL